MKWFLVWLEMQQDTIRKTVIIARHFIFFRIGDERLAMEATIYLVKSLAERFLLSVLKRFVQRKEKWVILQRLGIPRLQQKE
ncbi:hypothetical protein L1987_60010 [Smallanthus sonchifolius]|uniref:Uncharacterized protein n=1 Tax=Smallanthus sonchifolius TaxID=185202 RepID=A0ACB9D743_9ASTR|nr:hypothetical protein L1987_60010 [Smallanthus sonchifolius]